MNIENQISRSYLPALVLLSTLGGGVSSAQDAPAAIAWLCDVFGFEKHLVIKRILPGLARSPRFIKLFIKEAKITAGLAHPNIVQTVRC